ncbi:hypothetical protein [Moraxella marmotae]|uniref:hypothetical protein n=1 Tax=Moraxella marmotae TaxID=3344520 RepID=UPI0035D40A4B
MYHRKPEKYKEYEGMDNAVVGKGELIRVVTPTGVAYRTPCNQLIYDRQEALEYAAVLDKIIRHNEKIFTQKKLKGKPL